MSIKKNLPGIKAEKMGIEKIMLKLLKIFQKKMKRILVEHRVVKKYNQCSQEEVENSANNSKVIRYGQKY